MRSSALLTLLAVGLASAHFQLQWPPTAGFIDDDEPTAPCGGFTPEVNSSSPQTAVDRFAVSIYSSHPAGTWAFLGTTDTQAPYNFTELVPIVDTTGIGAFCLTYLRAPSDWAGKGGIIQVIDQSVDGILYQCGAVNFVSGANDTVGAACTNQTGFSATWTTSQSLNSTNATTTSPASTTSSVHTGAAAIATAAGGVLGGLGLLAAAGLVL